MIIRVVLTLWISLGTMGVGAKEMVASGQGDDGWVVLRAAIGSQASWTLYHVPTGEDEPATIARVRTLSALPAQMASSDNRVIMVFEDEGESGESVRSVRQLRVRYDAAGRARYEPSTRLQVMASLPGWGSLDGIVSIPGGALALLADPSSERVELLRLGPTEWEPIALPDGVSAHGVWGLAPMGGSAALIASERNTGLQRMWSLQLSEEGDGTWSVPVPLEVGPTDAIVAGAGDSIIVLRRQNDATLEADLVRESQHRITTLGGVGSGYVAMNVGGQVVLLWQEVDTPPQGSSEPSVTRLMSLVMLASGEVHYEGPVNAQALLTDNDLQKLTLLFGAVLVMILLFVLRPDPVAMGSLQIPVGHVVASPSRRIAAALIDLLPIVAIVSWMFGVPLVASLGFDVEASSLGLWPVLASASCACAMQTTTEWLFGWTPGKLAVRLRVHHAEGGRPGARQCLVRNLVKYACPPLTALMLLDPTRRHPGDYLGGTVVVMPASLASHESDEAKEEPPQAPEG
ncbi:MAG: RDD family protein [Planctomycetota bacterium]|jgi:uncharacterized RDD family membrane protein YckC